MKGHSQIPEITVYWTETIRQNLLTLRGSVLLSRFGQLWAHGGEGQGDVYHVRKPFSGPTDIPNPRIRFSLSCAGATLHPAEFPGHWEVGFPSPSVRPAFHGKDGCSSSPTRSHPVCPGFRSDGLVGNPPAASLPSY